ncbi:MAG: hypothetical protein ABSC23_14480 [Bryobacteraceae bacterium]|jgi:hypothetical protein
MEKQIGKKQPSKRASARLGDLVAALRYLHATPITKRDLLATAIGVEKYTASRVLAYLTDEGHVEKRGRWYTSRSGTCTSRKNGSNGAKLGVLSSGEALKNGNKGRHGPGRDDSNPTLASSPASEVAADAGDHRPIEYENQDVPLEMRAIEFLLYKAVRAWKAQNAQEAREGLKDAVEARRANDATAARRALKKLKFRPSYRRWNDLQWLLLYLVRMEPLAYLLWDGYRQKAVDILDERIPDWQNSMAWATRNVIGIPGDDDEEKEPENAGKVPDWVAGYEDDEIREPVTIREEDLPF